MGTRIRLHQTNSVEKSCCEPGGRCPRPLGERRGRKARAHSASSGARTGAGATAAPHPPHPHFCADLAGDSHSETQREASEEAARGEARFLRYSDCRPPPAAPRGPRKPRAAAHTRPTAGEVSSAGRHWRARAPWRGRPPLLGGPVSLQTGSVAGANASLLQP